MKYPGWFPRSVWECIPEPAGCETTCFCPEPWGFDGVSHGQRVPGMHSHGGPWERGSTRVPTEVVRLN